MTISALPSAIPLKEPFHATYDNAMEQITRLKNRFGGSALFGNEKDDSYKRGLTPIALFCA